MVKKNKKSRMLVAVNPYPTRLLGPIITSIFAERINQRERFDAGKVPTYSINQITIKVAAVNFLDGIELLDKVIEFHRENILDLKLKKVKEIGGHYRCPCGGFLPQAPCCLPFADFSKLVACEDLNLMRDHVDPLHP